MLSKFAQKIGYQLFFLIFLLVISLFLPMSYFAWHAVAAFGDSAVYINQNFIADRAFEYLLVKNKQQSLRYENYFEKVRVTATMLGVEAQHVYDSMDEQAGITSLPFIMWQNPLNSIFYSPPDQKIVTAYWGNSEIDSRVFKEIAALSSLDSLLITAKQQLPNARSVHMISASGVGRYFPDDEELKKKAEKISSPHIFDMRETVPYALVRDAVRDDRGARWTPAYEAYVDDGLMVTAAAPVYDRQNRLLAMVGIDISLAWLEHELLHYFPYNSQRKIEDSINFIVDDKGKLVVIPRPYLEVLGIDAGDSMLKDSKNGFIYSLLDSKNSMVRKLYERILSLGDSVFLTTISDEQYVVVNCKMARTGWNMVHLLRRDLLSQTASKTNLALDDTLNTLKKKFISFFLMVCATLVIAMILIGRRYIVPLQALGQMATEIGHGNLTVRSDLKRKDELGRVAASMNEMAAQLDRIDKEKQVYTKELEVMVEDRLRDLAKKNIELEQLVFQLHRERDRYQVTADALREQRERLKSITDFSLAGLVVTQDNVLKYYNHGFVKIAGYDKRELVGSLDFRDFVVEEDHHIIEQQLDDRIMGYGGRPYQIRGVRKDGSIVHVLIEGVPITWKGKPGALATLVDITPLKEIETKLQHSVEEKEVLLKEVYHRTKNNMLVIISLLNLQADEIDDPKTQKIFVETENRIRAMSLIHESLYQTHNLANIDIGDYLQNIANELVNSMTLEGQIKLTMKTESMTISIDKAMPLGLVANEIITNAIQHAFEGRSDNEILISLRKIEGDLVELVIGDNGVGMDPGFFDEGDFFGLMVISNLVRMQLQGKYSVSLDNGTCYTITFTD